MTLPVAIGIDIGGTNLKIALVDGGGRIIAKRARPLDAARGPGSALAEAGDLVGRLLAEAGLKRGDAVGAGVGSPGPLDLRTGVIIRSVNLPGWRNVRIQASLADRLGLPVVLDNDANAAAYGEFWVGAGREGGDLVMLTLGTGVGAGVILDGCVLHGHFDNAAELGHMIVVVDGLPCPCGQRGCLEQYASASAVSRRVEAAIRGGEESRLGATVKKGEGIDARVVAEEAAAGDELCLRIWNEACTYLAIACVNIQHAYNPGIIVLGGGMSEAGSFLIDRVDEQLRRRTWSLCEDLPTVKRADLAYDAGVIGAAGLAWRRSRSIGQ